MRETPCRREEGFSLIEVLVVILIIGVLAAIALPAFAGQQDKGKDASAKSDARSMVAQVESCFVETKDYTACDTAAEVPKTGLKVTASANALPADGEVNVTAAGATTYTVIAKSESGKNFFAISRGAHGLSHACGTALTQSAGAGAGNDASLGSCRGGTW